MTTGKIFLLNDNGKTLTPMTETGYVSENDLQTFLADHPDLLPGDQIDPESPRRWLLVAREMGVPGDVDETGRWSLDHLFLDQDGVPTFVECKRSQDTRSRREVVAQMLDYAANGIEYWSVDRIRQRAAETAQVQGQDLDKLLFDFLGVPPESELSETETIEDYWKSVEENLKQGKVRLIFVLDQSSRELRRLVEFLNQKMTDVRVFIVEICQFLGEAQTALVPRVLGITEQARSKQPNAAGVKKTPLQHTDLTALCSPAAAHVFTSAAELAEERNYLVRWNPETVVIRALHPHTGKGMTVVYCWIYSEELNFYFGDIKLPSERALSLRQELLQTGMFVESGQHTLKGVRITDENAPTVLVDHQTRFVE